jgi:hypothetical protein
MVNAAAKRPTGSKRKRARATTGKRGGTAGTARRRKAILSPADIAEIATRMHVPEGVLHLVLSHYPEVARALVRHRDSVG